MSFTPEQLSEIVAGFPNGSKKHHHKLVRELAEECLRLGFENVMLAAMVPEPVRQVHILEDCEKEVA
jgi:hypothetical protein